MDSFGIDLLLIRPFLLVIAIALSWNHFVAIFNPDIKMEWRRLISATIATSVALAAFARTYKHYGLIRGNLISTLGLLAAVLPYPHPPNGLASTVAASGFLLMHVWTGTG